MADGDEAKKTPLPAGVPKPTAPPQFSAVAPDETAPTALPQLPTVAPETMPSPAVASAPTTPTVTQSSPVEAPASPQLLLVQANTIQLIWKDNSCSVDAALVALYAATSGLRCFPSSDLDGLRTEVFGRFGDASLGDPLQYGKQQALQDIMLRVTQMFYIRTECEIQFQRRTVPAT